jgi:hypothetical protein
VDEEGGETAGLKKKHGEDYREVNMGVCVPFYCVLMS